MKHPSQKQIKIENPKEKYCYNCGQKQAIVLTGYYDDSSGKPFGSLECKNSECLFYYCDHQYRKMNILERILDTYSSDEKCVKCGKGNSSVPSAWGL